MSHVLELLWSVPPREIETAWRLPPRPIETAWRIGGYPDKHAATEFFRQSESYIAPSRTAPAFTRKPGVLVGPAGPEGPGGTGAIRIDAGLAATWTLPHDLGRPPLVDVFLESGEQVIADVVVSASAVTVMFAQPQRGFVMLG